ncbi:MAG TPA: sugar phosphate isomerase/epimerase family protein [Armatimonadota bacterium]|nr:sugar phosphate isomerase/epimerase family protein [Armatimonadota bacterium]
MNRREFLGASAGALAGIGLGAGLTAQAEAAAAGYTLPAGRRKWRKAMVAGMLPGDMSLDERFGLAKRAGFDGIEVPPMSEAEAAENREAAERNGLRIHSVIYGGWGAPLSSGDDAVVTQGLKEVEGALRAARVLRADAVLLVPAVVNEGTSYPDAYERSQRNIRKLVPLAKELGVVIGIENVWNNFLLSPVEFARYVDEFESPHVRAYLDLGNMVKFGWPEHWVQALGPRIAKVHLKDFRREGNQFVNLREGDVNWPLVTDWLVRVGYEGWFTTELGGGDEAYLKDVADRVDAIFAGK